MSDDHRLAAAFDMLNEYKSHEFLGITQDRQVAALMVAFAETALAQVERERDESYLKWHNTASLNRTMSADFAHLEIERDAAQAEVERLKGLQDALLSENSTLKEQADDYERRLRLSREALENRRSQVSALEADLARVRAALTKLLAELSDVQLEAVREGCGNTNAAVLQLRVDEMRAALEGRG